MHHDERVWTTGGEYLEDFREGEQLATDLVHLLAAVGDLNLVGLQRGVLRIRRYLRGSIVDHSDWVPRRPPRRRQTALARVACQFAFIWREPAPAASQI
jgi:hypothetical protein